MFNFVCLTVIITNKFSGQWKQNAMRECDRHAKLSIQVLMFHLMLRVLMA